MLNTFKNILDTTQNIRPLFQNCIDYGYFVRKNKQDGLAKWQDIKMSFDTQKLYLLKKLPFDFDGITLTIDQHIIMDLTELNHFIIQHFRIPHISGKYITTQKICQLAYNIGQAKHEFEQDSYHLSLADLYFKYLLNSIDTFIYID